MLNSLKIAQDDPFFQKHYAARPVPPGVPFQLEQGDRLLLIGDSITEARRYARILETYLTVCKPELHVEVRNIGKGGETAAGFLNRIDQECLVYAPTVATVCFGMNDAGYVNNNREAANKYRAASTAIVRRLKSAGARVMLASPGCIGKLPPWQFVADLGGTLDGLNTSLLYMRDEAAAIATEEQLPFVDHFWNLYLARLTALEQYGPDYALCGVYDGVHASWAGQVVMAYGFLQAFGFDGSLGNLSIDLAEKRASADQEHRFDGEKEGLYSFTSSRYPLCAEGLPEKDWSIRSGMTLVPFNESLNRLRLRVTGMTANRYRVAWMTQPYMHEEWHIYTKEALAKGINLAEDFHRNPFSGPYNRIDDYLFQKQTVEVDETWHRWEMEGKSQAEGFALCENRRESLLQAVQQAFVPVTHFIQVEPVESAP
jgi:lysophospholipase L1-like esterase